VKAFTKPGPVRNLLNDRIGSAHAWFANLVVGIPFVLLATLGLLAPLLLILVIRMRKRTPALLWLFPLLLIANFLAMFFGLALDFRSSTPDELSQRPVMLVYFFVVAWIGGALGLAVLESRRLGRIARPAIVSLAILLLAVPAFLGSGVQRMWAMPRVSPPLRVPIGLYRAAEYMRDHGDAGDIFQDSQFDRTYTVAALSERRTYVARTMTRTGYNAEKVEEREADIERFVRLRNAAAVGAFAQKLGIRWFLLDPSDQVRWPEEGVNRPVFELGGYRLYRF